MKSIAISLILSIALAGISLSEPPGKLGEVFTVPGTFSWKVGGQATGITKTTDFWWNHVSPTERYLEPQNKALAAVVATPFDSVTAQIARATTLTRRRISGEQLRPGTVVIFKTSAGRLGKFEVVGYTHLNDRGADIPEYDLQLRWLFL